MLIDIDSCSDF